MGSVTHTFAVEGMHCGSCALLIGDVLEDLSGVRSTATSMKRGRTVVEVDPDGCGPPDIIAAIAGLGYQASQLS
jgi:copper chaperone CopZ